MQHDDRFTGRKTIGIGQIFFIDVMPPHRHGQKNTQQTRTTKPEKYLCGAEMDWWIEDAFRIEHVEGREQDARKRGLPCACAHGLHNIVFAWVSSGSSQDENQGNETKKGGDD